MPRPRFIRRARSAREIGWCSRTRFSRIWRFTSRAVVRVARLKSRVLIFRMMFVRDEYKIPGQAFLFQSRPAHTQSPAPKLVGCPMREGCAVGWLELLLRELCFDYE